MRSAFVVLPFCWKPAMHARESVRYDRPGLGPAQLRAEPTTNVNEATHGVRSPPHLLLRGAVYTAHVSKTLAVQNGDQVPFRSFIIC